MQAVRFAKTLLGLALLLGPLTSIASGPARAQIEIDVPVITIAPPELPIYEQPPLPEDGYLWTPGNWSYADDGYYWVPGVWVRPPVVGLLWTPGYWGWRGGFYAFNRGYWGPHVGFYGGINYGFGYGGTGFFGGEWRGGRFAYNRVFNNFGGVHVTNVYNRTVIINRTTNVSFNGPGGIVARPTPAEETFARERHVERTVEQQRHFEAATRDPAQRASVNGGRPSVLAVSRPIEPHRQGAATRVAGASPAQARQPQQRLTSPAHVRHASIEHAQPQRMPAQRAPVPREPVQHAQAQPPRAMPHAQPRPPAPRPPQHAAAHAPAHPGQRGG